jgi:hypothetical protein
MERHLLFDLETDNLYDKVTKIHCIVALDLFSGDIEEFGPDEIEQGLLYLSGADLVAGFNIAAFDVPVIEKLYPEWQRPARLLCTKAMSRVLYPGPPKNSILKKKDFAIRAKRGADAMPGNLIGIHSLGAWAHRLRLDVKKTEYTEGWDTWTPEMQAYCRNDVLVNAQIHKYFMARGWPQRVFEIESEMCYLLHRQEQFGVGFDEGKAVALMGTLVQERGDLTRELTEEFGPEYRPDGPNQGLRVPKRTTSSKKYKPGEAGYTNTREGCEFTKVKLVEFNPGSQQHIGRRLIRDYGWEPNDFGKDGNPSVTDDILTDLPWPVTETLARYQVLKKLLGYISEGKNAWLKLCRDGRLHPRVNATGAITHRGSHHEPNTGQVPKVSSPYGLECRSLFRAGGGCVPGGWALVGADASALQLAIYAHYVGRYDGGKLARVVETSDGHEYMQECSGLLTREIQKRLTYATWFGAKAYRQGLIIIDDYRLAKSQGLYSGDIPALSEAARLGRRVDKRLRTRMAGYKDLIKALDKAGERGWLKALDGRKVPILQKRLAMSSLLQGNEAAIMKIAYVKAFHELDATFNRCHWGFVLWVHDEYQVACAPDIADKVGPIIADAITDAGAELGLRLKLGAEWKKGMTWADTH